MKHRLGYIPYFVASCIAVWAFFIAPTCSASTFSSPAAKSYATLLANHYRAARTLHAVFLERYTDGPDEARVESGSVYFERPGRMRWDYEAPEKKVFISDGKTVWFYVPADHTVTRTPVKESADWRQPLALLTGKADLAKLCREVSVQGPTGEPAGHVVLRCVPKGEAEDVSSKAASATGLPGSSPDFTDVLLEVNAETGELARVTVRQRGGIELEYRFGGWEENMPLPEPLFRFEPPAGVAIVDGAALGSTLQ